MTDDNNGAVRTTTDGHVLVIEIPDRASRVGNSVIIRDLRSAVAN